MDCKIAISCKVRALSAGVLSAVFPAVVSHLEAVGMLSCIQRGTWVAWRLLLPGLLTLAVLLRSCCSVCLSASARRQAFQAIKATHHLMMTVL